MAADLPATSGPVDAVAETLASQPKITLYWLEKSRSQRILWLLEELQVPYDLEIFHRDKKTNLAPPELKKIHALGKSPVISIALPDSTEPLLIAESAFIIEYLIEHFGKNTKLAPKQWKDGQESRLGGETEEWMRYRYFLHYTEGSLMTPMIVSLIATNIKNAPVPFFIKPITSRIAGNIQSSYLEPNFAAHFSFLEERLRTAPGGGGYLCGPSLTGADIILSFPLIAAKARSALLTEAKYPLLLKFTTRLEQNPGYKRAANKIIEMEGSFEPTL